MQADAHGVGPAGPAERAQVARIEGQLARVRALLATGTVELRALSARAADVERLAADVREAQARGDQEWRSRLGALHAELRALAGTIEDQEHANRHDANVLAALEHLLGVARAAAGGPGR